MGVKLRERPGKGWYVLIDWQGKRKAKSFGRDKKRAELFAETLECRMKLAKNGGTPLGFTEKEDIQEKVSTVKESLIDWQNTHAIVHCKPSTYRGYARAIEQHLIPAFGHFSLNELERSHVRYFIATLMKQGKARGTIENFLVPLKAIYYQAMDDGKAEKNPAWRLGKIFNQRKERKASLAPLERGEVAHLLKTANDRFPYFFPLLLCATRTGMRQGELIGLQWGDIDFLGGFIEVRRGVVLRQETTTKSHKIRRVDMSQQLQDVLHRIKEVRQLEAMSEGREMVPWVFLSPGGGRWDDRHLRRVWQRTLTGQTCVKFASMISDTTMRLN
ncbi:MAG: tyrosine-type recombinase/integrase [Nitrospirae bacterium]|nr:tyrosine-type recombinase/integrase [Nitrospirota bacterium]